MESIFKIKMVPNGHGGLLEALNSQSDLREQFKQYEYIQVIGADNALCKVLDPVHIGFTHFRDLDSAVKVIQKKEADEQIAIVARKNDRYAMIEPSDMPIEQNKERDNDGSLHFKHGNMHNFVCRSDFLLGLTAGAQTNQMNLSYHKALKKISHTDPKTWEQVNPEKENAWLFELFFSGYIPYIKLGKLGILEVDRQTEYAPVTYEDGPTLDEDEEPLPDTPAMAFNMVMQEMT